LLVHADQQRGDFGLEIFEGHGTLPNDGGLIQTPATGPALIRRKDGGECLSQM
jgi:hypothetical protein